MTWPLNPPVLHDSPPCQNVAPRPTISMAPGLREKLSAQSCEHLLAAAHAHGDASGVEYEAGDLQDVVRACWKRMSPEARREVVGECADLLAEWGGDADGG